ncbi:hypothetical protein [Clostridium sp.]|uniref:hypothetical protein n=1 Tax=Clostridium sp. TaxID=1506 RepID=UPI001A611F1A|nr:hypothetical protein [Clostridium sp.]MBK5242638.1 hypothetical protein [Clostridium sp.]
MGKTIKILASALQVIILIFPIVLQYLSDKKMGVKRYLVFKKTIFSEETFTPNLMFMYKLVLILGIIVSIALLIYYSIVKVNNALIKSSIKVTVMNFIIIFFVFSKQFEELLTYHFFLISIFVIIILQYIKLYSDWYCSKNIRPVNH